jgi:predicted XRE-type DNA-binding protein
VKITATIQAAAIASGQTQKTIAESTGVPQSVISEFFRTGRCSSRNLDAIAAYFGIEAKVPKKIQKQITVQPRHDH